METAEQKVQGAFALLRSVIISREPWTKRCALTVDGALDALRELQEAEAKLRDLVNAADALRERVSCEDQRANEFGRWNEATIYDDLRLLLGEIKNGTG